MQCIGRSVTETKQLHRRANEIYRPVPLLVRYCRLENELRLVLPKGLSYTVAVLLYREAKLETTRLLFGNRVTMIRPQRNGMYRYRIFGKGNLIGEGCIDV